jgi:glutamine cyclotransferase
MAGILLATPATLATPSDASGIPPALEWEVISRRPHDPGAFTQGLQLDPVGRLYESTGRTGQSTLREVDPHTGAVLRSVPLPATHFGEGLALVDDRLIQLTWLDGVATAWDADTFEPFETFSYGGEGWGLCHDGERLIMSDGSDELTFRDPSTFEVMGSVSVSLGGEPLRRLNELECVEGLVWANVWTTDTIVRIDPADGRVTGILDLVGIVEPHPVLDQPGAVLNGIAYDSAADTFLVTGKLWPELIEIRVSDTRVSENP